MSKNIKTPKKLIEVALPLDDINAAAAKEKSIRHGHPSTLHLWWARRPLAAARAIIFAQMVNDPGYQQGSGFKYGVNKEKAAFEREKLFDIIRDLVKWENTDNEEVLNRAREAIKKSWGEICELNKDHSEATELFNPNNLPAFHDPFAGGGALPLEAQRLGLESFASDLNPVAVLINKAMIEIPPKFAELKPVGPISARNKQQKLMDEWPGATGLAEDVRRYGNWMHEESYKRIGHLYPTVLVTKDMTTMRKDLIPYIGKDLTVIAWLWARTVKSPNPMFSHVHVPLVSSFILSSKKNKEAWIAPIVGGDTYKFEIRVGKPTAEAKKGTKIGRGANFRCVLSNSPIQPEYIKSEGAKGSMGAQLIAMVAEGKRGRVYLSPLQDAEMAAKGVDVQWKPNIEFAKNSRHMTPWIYGLTNIGDLFTNRQLSALNSLSESVDELREKVTKDAIAAGMEDDGLSLESGGRGATAYGEAISIYLTFAIDRAADSWSSLTSWTPQRDTLRSTFGRQALSMVWDYAEVNPFSASTGNFGSAYSWIYRVIEKLPAFVKGTASQVSAMTQEISTNKVVSTDPPYYDNVPYADLSDFFYGWMRRNIRCVYPSIFSTVAVPKSDELVADNFRHENASKAEKFFLEGMTHAISNLAIMASGAFPITIYYAFKQSDTGDSGTASTGWETFLEAVLKAGFAITGTWPVRTERAVRSRGIGANALASSIVLVCQKRSTQEESISRREFQRKLREEMPEALEAMIGGRQGTYPIAPVDLAQAAIGPGMGIFSKFDAVLNQDGTNMTVHDALLLINRAITDYLHPDTGNFDKDTLFCDSWFSEYGWSAGDFGQANVLATAKGTTVDGVCDAGVIESGVGKVRLINWQEYPTDWDPKKDNRTPIWEALHHLIRALNQQGETGAGRLLAGMPEQGESIRQLAYHLYTFCERKNWAEDARAYNELITAWHSIVIASHDTGHVGGQF